MHCNHWKKIDFKFVTLVATANIFTIYAQVEFQFKKKLSHDVESPCKFRFEGKIVQWEQVCTRF